MNTDFYENLDINFERACELSEKKFSHEELINYLQTGNIPEKQIAALKLDCVKNQEEAQILIANLTGCDGKIREAVALKINQILSQNNNFKPFFTKDSNYETFADATIDINGNICRLVIDSVAILKDDKNFSTKYLERIIEFINQTFKELDSFIFRDKKYVINKQLFKLYWCLEALNLFKKDIDPELLLRILNRAIKEKEYTIREKVAQIITTWENNDFKELIAKLQCDENYYVREALKK